MLLFINTTDFAKITYAIVGSSFYQKEYTTDPHESHNILKFFEQFLKTSKIKPAGIKKIVVCSGPGSYTGTRIGVTHALALGFAWNVPVKAMEAEKFSQLLKNTSLKIKK